MSSVKRYHFIFLTALFIIDLIINSITAAYIPHQIRFISNLHFMGILILSQHESKEQSLFKAFVFGIIMELIHVNSFPIYILSYTLTVAIILQWERYLGFSVLEFLITIVIALFIKETMIYALVYIMNTHSVYFFNFLAARVFWVIIGNVMLSFIVFKGYKRTHQAILKRAENIYMK